MQVAVPAARSVRHIRHGAFWQRLSDASHHWTFRASCGQGERQSALPLGADAGSLVPEIDAPRTSVTDAVVERRRNQCSVSTRPDRRPPPRSTPDTVMKVCPKSDPRTVPRTTDRAGSSRRSARSRRYTSCQRNPTAKPNTGRRRDAQPSPVLISSPAPSHRTDPRRRTRTKNASRHLLSIPSVWAALAGRDQSREFMTPCASGDARSAGARRWSAGVVRWRSDRGDVSVVLRIPTRHGLLETRQSPEEGVGRDEQTRQRGQPREPGGVTSKHRQYLPDDDKGDQAPVQVRWGWLIAVAAWEPWPARPRRVVETPAALEATSGGTPARRKKECRDAAHRRPRATGRRRPSHP